VATSYDPLAIEAKWLKRWNEEDLYRVDLDRAPRPFYNLMEFPYPSGEGLHVGHFYSYAGADAFGRYRRMAGNDVFQPMGFDAFGIHGENYALMLGENPAVVMPRNIRRFREEQIKRMGAAFDWSREVDTTDPRYYKWTQWIFVQLFKAGLAYRATSAVNWCPKDLTVLADEQVVEGHCERCGTPVVRRDLEQWFFRITAYAERLLDHSHAEFTDTTKTLQRNWIGRSEGAEVTFHTEDGEPFVIYTTRPDTLWGATFMVLAPEHPLVSRVTTAGQQEAVGRYAALARQESSAEREDATREKTGVFTGACARNPANGELIPIWVADYVLMGYGTGAIMAVPAHDQRDLEFARAYGLPVRVVVQPAGQELEAAGPETAWDGEGILVNSGPLNGTPTSESVSRTVDWLVGQGLGKRAVRYRLRDWLISRQRYWGPPIPMVHCDRDGWQPVPEDELPVRLPMTDNFRPTGTGASPLASIPGFAETTCPLCGGSARRETDVSDNFLDSAWYFLRYTSTEFDDRPWDAGRVRKWLPVDHYMGGVEHSTLHHLYVRFLWKALLDMGHLPAELGQEPFKQLRLHGWILRDGAKMSKSRGNVVNPDHYVRKYGADVMRAHMLFAGDYVEGGDFRDSAIVGILHFFGRLWEWSLEGASLAGSTEDEVQARRAVHRAIKKVGEDIPALKFNTALATLMETLNALRGYRLSRKVRDELARHMALLLAPIAPFLAEELWERLGGAFSVHQQAWPAFDPALLAQETVVVAVQVNGKMRGRLEVERGTEPEELLRQAVELPEIARHTAGKRVVKTFHVPDRLLNILVE
jgi:leucyl-tRNA synthetase